MDSVALAEEISRRAVAAERVIDVYVEVNIAGEESKSGVSVNGVEPLCRKILSLPGLSLKGLMTMAPHCERAEDYRTYFRATRELAEEIWQQLGRTDRPRLSMGMSESFTAAILEGTGAVRVGRRLFLK